MDVFETSGGTCQVDQLRKEWLDTARRHGIPVDDQDGDLLPDMDDAINPTVTAAIWLGITTGYFTLAGSATTSPASTYSYPHHEQGGLRRCKQPRRRHGKECELIFHSRMRA